MNSLFNNIIDSGDDLIHQKSKPKFILLGVLILLFGVLLVYTELSYPFRSYVMSSMNIKKVDWMLLLSDYRTSVIGFIFSILGGVLLIRKSSYGWWLSFVISLSYLIVYSREFFINISAGRYQSITFLVLMILVLLFFSILLGIKSTRLELKIGYLEMLIVLILTVIFLQQYYR